MLIGQIFSLNNEYNTVTKEATKNILVASFLFYKGEINMIRIRSP